MLRGSAKLAYHGLRCRSAPRCASTPMRLLARRSGKKPTAKPAAKGPRTIRAPELCTAERLAQELNMPTARLMEIAGRLGEPIDAPVRPLTSDLIELLAMECGVTIEIQPVDVSRRPRLAGEAFAQLPVRPPVVTLMGHVDHGKTSLLDALRGSDIAGAEAGGITQGISAFTVDEGTAQAMTFIDTPGHELFASMRQRGARATDVIVLVVAVDSGVQPTTVQAIEYAREMSVPIVVAANKIDRAGAEEGRRKIVQQLLEHGVAAEEMGGDVPVVGVSATKRLNLDDLREAVLLQAELLELHCEADGPAEGVVLEATTEKGLGIVSSVLVQRGALRPSDFVTAGETWGKVRVMRSAGSTGNLRVALPSMPVRISGLREVPRTGDELIGVASEARAKQVSEFRVAKRQMEEQAVKTQAEANAKHEAISRRRELKEAAHLDSSNKEKEGTTAKVGSGESGESGSDAEGGPEAAEVKLVPALLKADSAGALEAVLESISHFPDDRVKLKVIKAELGEVTEADVNLADTFGATIVGFNVGRTRKTLVLAEERGVGLITHSIIYELADGVKELLDEAIEPVLEEKVVGTADVQQLFTLTLNRKDRKEGMSKQTQVAGLRVSSGEASVSSRVRVLRGDEGVHDGKVVTLRHYKQEVKTVRQGQECGAILANFSACQEGDKLSFYEIVARKPSLYDSSEK